MGVLDPEYTPGTPGAGGYNYKPSSGLSKTDTLAIGMVVQTGLAAYHSHEMDKIRYRMQRDRIRFKRAAQAESRRYQAAMGSMNQEKLEQALFSESLALEISQMQTEAKVQNAVNATDFSVDSPAVRDLQRKNLRESLYMERTHEAKRQQAEVSAIDVSRSQEVIYDPIKPDGANQAATFVTDALTVGNMAYGRFTNKAEE